MNKLRSEVNAAADQESSAVIAELAEIAARLRAVRPESAVHFCRVTGALVASLTPAEQAAVKAAVPKRRREFAAGRWLARACATELDFTDLELLVGPSREPLWPPQLVGSISHTRTAALCWMERSCGSLALGVDLEPRAPLELALWKDTLTAQEIAALPSGQQEQTAMLLFSAKESIYKAIHGQVGRFVDFHEVSLMLQPGGIFRLSFDGPLRAQLEPGQLSCGALSTRHWIATWCVFTYPRQ